VENVQVPEPKDIRCKKEGQCIVITIN
jgi:hypothetical protein